MSFCQIYPQWVVKAGQNFAVLGSLKEVYKFLHGLPYGVIEARIINTDETLRLTESGNWIWVIK